MLRWTGMERREGTVLRLVIDGQRLTAARTGVGRCLELLLEDWARTGWPMADVVLVLRDRAGLERVPRAEGLKTLVVGKRWPGLVWETFGLGRVLRRGDLLFAPANLVPWNWRGATVAVLYDTLPWSVPESFPWHVRARFGHRYRMTARRAARLIVPSHCTARDVARVHGVPSERIEVVYPAPDPRFRPLLADAPEVLSALDRLGLRDAPFFLFVGKRSQRRNVPAVLSAFARFHELQPAYRLVFVGPGGGESVPADAPGVVVAGHVSEEILHGLLASAHGLVYPSNYEGFGLPVVEAQACGCPVVTLRNSALEEAGGNAAWYLDSPDANAIEQALEALATRSDLRAGLRSLGLANASRFRADLFAQGVKEVLRQVASNAQWALTSSSESLAR